MRHDSRSIQSRQLETAYPPQSTSAAQMRQTLRAYLSGQAVDAKVIHDVVLAADEAFINAVGHAAVPDDLIHVTARVSDHEASVEIHDGGGGFALSASAAQPVPDIHRAHGRGVFIMKCLMDEVSVSSGRKGTTVRMVRHLA